MQWWCAARGSAWTWSWQAYPGVWLLVLAIALAYWRFFGFGRRLPARHADTNADGAAGSRGVPPRGWPGWFVTGLLCLWIALKWARQERADGKPGGLEVTVGAGRKMHPLTH